MERYARRYLREVSRMQPIGRLVDVGPSLSPFPNIACEAGYQVTAIDYIRPKSLSENVDFIEGNLNDIGILGKIQQHTFDIVCSFAVIEHCMYPELACRILSQLCRTGGYVILTTPEIGTFATSNALGRSGWFHPPSHLFLLSKDALVTMFQNQGCKLVGSSRFELNMLRFFARYGIGTLEGCCGLIAKFLIPRWWEFQRTTMCQRYKGIALYIFQKHSDGNDE